MIENHLSNPFANTELSNGRFGKYADEHLARLLAAQLPDALFGPRLAATQAALTAFTSGRKANAVASAAREGKTVTLDKAIQRLQKFVSIQAPVLAALFTDLDKDVRGTDTAAYQAFFPQGVEAITKANKATLDAAVAPFVAAATQYQAQIGAPTASKVTALVADIAAARQAQLASKGATKDTQTDRVTARTALALELFVNLLTLLIHHAADPGQVRAYFNVAILKEYTGSPRPAPAPPVVVTP